VEVSEGVIHTPSVLLKFYFQQHKYKLCPAVMSGSDIDRFAATACGWGRDIRRTDSIKGDER